MNTKDKFQEFSKDLYGQPLYRVFEKAEEVFTEEELGVVIFYILKEQYNAEKNLSSISQG